MKRTISLMLVALLLVAVMAPTAFATGRGEPVTVTVSVTGEAFAGLSGNLTYDADALTYVSCSSSTGTPMFNPNGGYFSWYTSENVSGTVSTISVTFTVNENAPCGSADVAVSNILVGNEDGVAVEASVSVSGASVDHIPGEAVKENDTHSTCSVAGGYDMVVRCTKCNEVISSEHTDYELAAHTESIVAGKSATCTENGLTDGIVCSVCKATIKAQEVISAGHKPAAAVIENEIAATCGKAGSYDSVVYCSACGVELSRETIPVPATGNHVYTKKYLCLDDTYHCMICDNCGEHSESEKHNHNIKNETTGYWECICGHQGDKISTGGGNTDNEPKNGDITPYPVFFVMAVAAVMGTAYGFKRKFVK